MHWFTHPIDSTSPMRIASLWASALSAAVLDAISMFTKTGMINLAYSETEL
jgi:hypothetical protein